MAESEYLKQLIRFWNNYLHARWPDHKFKVEMRRNLDDFYCTTRIEFMLQNRIMYVEQIDHEAGLDVFRFKVKDTTIATIMLLLGE